LLLDAGSSFGAWLRDGGRFSISGNVKMMPMSENEGNALIEQFT
jgi:hypothetical protein